MSRIDQVLRLREGGGDAEVPESAATGSTSSPSLHQYQQEEAGQHRHEDPSPPRFSDVTPVDPPVVAARQPSGDAAKWPGTAYLRARLVTKGADSVALEQYRRLAHVLHAQQAEKPLKTVMITSALPGEGKTLTVVNVALTLSESYTHRVLVVDADLRGPTLHKVLGIPNDRGLTEALRDPHQPLPFVEISSRLSALTAGQPGPTPFAGLTSSRMGEVIEECASRFDWVLLDTSPVGVLPDAQVLARLVGGVIFVIAAGVTPAPVVVRAIEELGPDVIIGTVLNGVDEREIPAADYYGHYGSPGDRH